MKKMILTAIVACLATAGYAQKYMTRTGKVTFFSSTPVENIEAFNNEMASVLNASDGSFIFQVPIKSFKFEKSLMRDHFNENYMESDKYPKATYKGEVIDISSVNFSKNGTYKVNTKGSLTIHGVTKSINVPGTVTVKGDNATINTVFSVSPKDYGIEIPKLVEGKIADNIEVTVNSILDKK